MKKRVIRNNEGSHWAAYGSVIDIETGKVLGPVWTKEQYYNLGIRYGQFSTPELSYRGIVNPPSKPLSPAPGFEREIHVIKHTPHIQSFHWDPSDPNTPDYLVGKTTFHDVYGNPIGTPATVHNINYPTLSHKDVDQSFNMFAPYDASHRHIGPILTSIDIETGGRDEVINYGYSQYQLALLPNKGFSLEYIKSAQRFFTYDPKGIGTGKYYTNLDVHHLTPETLKVLNATSRYTVNDANTLFEEIKNTKLIGYNIWGGNTPGKGFDLPKLFTHDQINYFIKHEGIFDLMMLMEDIHNDPGTGKRFEGLSLKKDDLIKAFTNQTMQQLGFVAHSGLGDSAGEAYLVKELLYDPQLKGIIKASLSSGITYTGHSNFDMFLDKGIIKSSKEILGMDTDLQGLGSNAAIVQQLQGLIGVLKDYPSAFDKEIKRAMGVVQTLDKSAVVTSARYSIRSHEVGDIANYIEAGRENNTVRQWAIRSKYGTDSEWDAIYKTREEAAISELNARYQDRYQELEKWARKNNKLDQFQGYASSATTVGQLNEVKENIQALIDSENLVDERINSTSMFRLRRALRKANNNDAWNAYNTISGNEDPETFYNKIADVEDKLKETSKSSSGTGDDIVKLSVKMHLLSKSIHAVGQAVDGIIGIFDKFNQISMSLPIWTNMSVSNQYGSQLSGVFSAANGLIPSPVLNIAGRVGSFSVNGFNRHNAALDYEWNKKEYAAIKKGEWWKRVGAVLSGTGTAITASGAISTGAGIYTANPFVAGAGAIVTGAGTAIGAVGHGFTTHGDSFLADVRKARSDAEYSQNMLMDQLLIQKGQDIQGRLNMANATMTYVTTPFKILGTVLKSVIGIISRFGMATTQAIDSLSGLGHPITTLSGVDYGMYAGSGLLEAAGGFQQGTISSMANNWAVQRTGMYRLGSMNMQRVTAAAMLGVFGDVYASQGSTSSGLERTINKLLDRLRSNPSEKYNIIGLASSIDTNLPGVLETLQRLNISYSDFIKPVYGGYNAVGMWTHHMSDAERNHAARVYAQWDSAQDTFTTIKQRVGIKIWDAFGKNLFNGFNKALDNIVSNLENSKFFKWLQNLGNDIAAGDWDSVWKDVKSGLDGIGNAFGKLFGWIVEKAADAGNLILDIWDTILIKMADTVDNILYKMSGWHLDVGEMIKALTGKGDWSKAIWYTDPGTAPWQKRQEEYEEDLASYNTRKARYEKARDKAIEFLKKNNPKGFDISYEEFIDQYAEGMRHPGTGHRSPRYEQTDENTTFWSKVNEAFREFDPQEKAPEMPEGAYDESGLGAVTRKILPSFRKSSSALFDAIVSGMTGGKFTFPEFTVNIKQSMDVTGASDKGGGSYVIPGLLEFKIESTSNVDKLNGALIAKSVGVE